MADIFKKFFLESLNKCQAQVIHIGFLARLLAQTAIVRCV